MGIGQASGENRASDAAKQAISSPLLEVSMDGAKGILFIVSGGTSLSMHEINESAKVITGAADPQAKIIFGAIVDPAMGEDIKITVVATGFNSGKRKQMPDDTTAYVPHSSSETKSSYSIPVSSVVKEEEDDEPENTFVVKEEEDDLDIPAFIRRKME